VISDNGIDLILIWKKRDRYTKHAIRELKNATVCLYIKSKVGGYGYHRYFTNSKKNKKHLYNNDNGLGLTIIKNNILIVDDHPLLIRI
jgi:hypothetical protein